MALASSLNTAGCNTLAASSPNSTSSPTTPGRSPVRNPTTSNTGSELTRRAINTAPSPVVMGPPPVVAPTQAPVVTGFRQSATSWVEGTALAHASAKRKRSPVGTTFSFALNEAANYVLSFTQIRAGREVKGRCVAQSRRDRHNPTCPRSVPRGSCVSSSSPRPRLGSVRRAAAAPSAQQSSRPRLGCWRTRTLARARPGVCG
jgi:hypothetical protein